MTKKCKVCDSEKLIHAKGCCKLCYNRIFMADYKRTYMREYMRKRSAMMRGGDN